MAKQILFGLHGEGSSDYRFLGQLLFRYIPQRILDMDMDLETLPFIELKGGSGQGFVEKLLEIENGSKGIQGILVHMDADSRDENEVLSRKWEPFISNCNNREIWIPIIPVQKIESWMLCDKEALSDLFIIEVREIERIMGGRRPENISDGKSVIQSFVSTSGQDISVAYIQENLGKRISFDKLLGLESFQRFAQRLDDFLSRLGGQ